ncbi:ATP-binding cassette domain-containing protein [Thermogemmatispora tikiterensis]|uniref:ATP-binding cassette domain-containing protein n=1 Tax=Thermogemmatispora tikiterensis TaxID=1825093 RepID=UPI000DD8B2F6
MEVKRLTKSFGTFTAVDQVSFAIRPGSIVGLLGSNGAGKTTLLSMLCWWDSFLPRLAASSWTARRHRARPRR